MFTPNEYGLFSMPTLETPRLTLRRMTMKDAKDVFEYSRDADVARHVLWSAQKDIGEAKDYCRYMTRRYRADEPSSWGIVDKKTGRLVGTIGYMNYDMDNASVEIGYSLAKWMWNGGYMTEALRRVIDYTFDAMDINRIEAQHELDNPASGRVMEKCGFSNDVSQMTAARKTKIIFCELLMDEMPETSRLFGIERDAMTYKGESYDVENDFHGIYFLYGAVGLGLFIIFLAYFAVLIVIALFRNVQKYFTMEAGAYGMAFLLALANAYNTAGILRRPNASFYLSVILAVIFYLTRIKQYPETQPKGIFALFGKKKTIKNG